MVPHVEFVAFDQNMVITKENWVATRLHCPKCGNGTGNVWVCTSDKPAMLDTLEMRRFICVMCQFAALGLGGFQPTWSVSDRVKQIMKFAFGEVGE
jgi:hypothetical protein